MKIYLLYIILLLDSCTFETHVSGIIVDERTKLPIQSVLVSTIKDINGRLLEFAETKSSKDGKFDLRFSSKSIRDPKVSVELSKPGYQTNIYICYEGRTADTLILRRE